MGEDKIDKSLSREKSLTAGAVVPEDTATAHAVPATKTLEVPTPVPNVAPSLRKGVDDFVQTLPQWTKNLENQVQELSKSFDMLKNIADKLPGILEHVKSSARYNPSDEQRVECLHAFPAL